MTVESDVMDAAGPYDRARALSAFKLGDVTFYWITRACAISVLLILGGIIISLIVGAWPAIREYGAAFLWTQRWAPSADPPVLGALGPIYGTLITSVIAMMIAIPVGLGIAIFLTEICPLWLRRPIGLAIELLAGIPSIIYGMWGFFVLGPFLANTFQPFMISVFDGVPVLGTIFAGPPSYLSLFNAALILAIMVLPFITAISVDVFKTVPPVLKEAAYGVGCTTWEVVRNVVIPYTRVGVIGGIMLALGRALGETMAVTFIIGNSFKIQSSIFAPGTTISAAIASEFAESDGLHQSGLILLGLLAVRADVLRSCCRTADADAAGKEGGELDMNPIYASRRRNNIIIKFLCLGAALFGVTWLALILFTLFYNGLAGINLAVFTQDTPPPGSTDGGLAQRHHRLDHDDRDRGRHRRAARPVRRHVSGRIRQARQAHLGDPLHQRHPVERAVDHHRPVHLRRHRGADGRLLGLRRLSGAGRDRDPRGGAHHRGHAGAGAQSAARGGVRARPAALAGDPADRLSRRARGPDHRRAAGDRPRRRRNRAAVVHRAVEPVLQPRT